MKFEFILLLRQRLVLITLVICALLAGLSLWNGWVKTQSIHQQINAAVAAEKLRFNNEIAHYGSGGEAGETGYYVYHTVYNKPALWSFISLGNRSFSPNIQRIKLLGLQAQLYDGEAHNPEYAVAGNFDYAFVVVFILPLLCIALAYDLCSIERSQNRLTLLQSLSTQPIRFWGKRFLTRWLAANLSVLLPLIACVAYLNLPWLDALSISIAVMFYALFWLLLSGILSFYLHKPSNNAILCLNIWLCVTLLAPSIAKVLIDINYPALAGAEIALSTRQKTNNAWDLPKQSTFDVFFTEHPEWKETSAVTSRFHYKWYYAFHHVADMSVRSMVQTRNAALIKRNDAGRRLGLALPSVALQYWLDDLAQNNLQSLLSYREKVTQFHTKLRTYFYPYFFNEIPFNADDFKSMPRFTQP